MNKNQTYEKNRYQRAKDAGICVTCRKHPVSYNRSPSRPNTLGKPKTLCDSCYDKQYTLKFYTYRLKALEAYGGKCVCCGISDFKYLELDHVNGDGHSHRKEIGQGNNVFRWAIRNNFPNILQLLCANCHRARTYYGGCNPH